MNGNSKRAPHLLMAGLMVLLSLLFPYRDGQAQDDGWTPPIVLSSVSEAEVPIFSWFPDLAVDASGRPHVTWCQTLSMEEGGFLERVAHSRRQGDVWTTPNDVVLPSPDIVRHAIATDLSDNLHLLFGGSAYGSLRLYYQRAPVEDAWSAAAWSEPHRINQGISYTGDMAVDSQDVIHVIYDDTIFYEGEEASYADIFYRRSADGGLTWSQPFNLNLSPETGSSRPQLEIASDDRLLVTWDEGWDRLSGTGEPTHSLFTASTDGGQTWLPPTAIAYPDATVAQLTVGSDGEGGVMLVWRNTTRQALYYQWSIDGGYAWTPPLPLPKVYARPWDTPFDMYDMTTDSAGRIHLLVVGRDSPRDDALLGVYHLIWDGEMWSVPERIFGQPRLYPEYPKIVVHAGDQLHTVWFTRQDSVWDQTAPREVWYSRRQIEAPHRPVQRRPSATPVPPTVTPPPEVVTTPSPAIELESTGLPDGLYTESDEMLQLLIALSPLVLLLLIVLAVKKRWLSRW